MLGVSAARAARMMEPESAAPDNFRKSRRRIFMCVTPHTTAYRLANLHVLPARLLAGRLVDRRDRQRFGFACGRNGRVEIARRGRLLCRLQLRFSRKPFVAQLV